MSPPPLFAAPLTVRALTRCYGQHIAVRDLSFEITSGEVVGLLGPNGAGKTTLLETTEGVQSPTRGEVLVFGCKPRALPAHIRAKVGFVFQRNALPEHVNVAQIVALYQRIFGKTEALNEMVEKLGLSHLLTRIIGELSVGQRQRLSVFAALAGSPSLILMDEPTNALDLRSRRAVWDVILSGKRERSLSGLIATHNMEEAQILCDRILFIEKGQLQGELSVSAMQEQPQSALSVRFSAPFDFVTTSPLLQKLIPQIEQGNDSWQLQCPKESLSELVAILLEGEHSHGFDARLEISQQDLESAYLSHVEAAD